MVGTDEGTVILCSRRFKVPSQKIVALYETHTSPLLALHRNPFVPKLFAAFGAWVVQLWSEDNTESPLLSLVTDKGYVTDGAWSPTRPSALFLTKTTGCLEVWDILLKQHEPVLTLKLDGGSSLTRVGPEEGRGGGAVAVGASDGRVYLLQMPSAMTKAPRAERNLVAAMAERDAKREKLSEPRTRPERLLEREHEERETEAERLRELAIDTSWAPSDSGEELFGEMEQLEKGFLPDETEREIEREEQAERTLGVEPEAGEADFLERLARDVQTTSALRALLSAVTTEVESDNSRFPFRELVVDEEFGEDEFDLELERHCTTVLTLQSLLKRVADESPSLDQVEKAKNLQKDQVEPEDKEQENAPGEDSKDEENIPREENVVDEGNVLPKQEAPPEENSDESTQD